MKKIIPILLIMTMLFCGCSDNAKDTKETTNTTKKAEISETTQEGIEEEPIKSELQRNLVSLNFLKVLIQMKKLRMLIVSQ